MVEFSRIFLYVSAFGLSDIFVKTYVTSSSRRFWYYLILGCIGYGLTKRSSLSHR